MWGGGKGYVWMYGERGGEVCQGRRGIYIVYGGRR